jgi:hypothetical protein
MPERFALSPTIPTQDGDRDPASAQAFGQRQAET